MYENIINFPKPVNDTHPVMQERLTPQQILDWLSLEEDVESVLIIAERRCGRITVASDVCDTDDAMALIDLGIDCLVRKELD